jgi:hypothetical protein
MKLRSVLGAIFTAASLGLSVLPAAAADRDPFEQLDVLMNPEVLFRGVIREDDVSLVFKHLRESIAASARGEEPRESEALARRKDEISREMAVRGGVLLNVMLNAFEAAAKQAIREEFGGARSRSVPRREMPFPSLSD